MNEKLIKDDEDIKLYLDRDRCLKTSDKYLLAMVLTYFRRAKLRIKEYRQYFFPSLFLANQFEEDEEFRDEMYAWTPGRTLRTIKRNQLLHLRDLMLIKMDFRAWVEKETCDLIMAQDPDHWAWKRQREDHHSWAIRWFRRDISEFTIRGPWTTLPTCSLYIILQAMIILACIYNAIMTYAIIMRFICKRCKNKEHQDAELLGVIVHNLGPNKGMNGQLAK
ncbi:speedy protein 1-A-like [Leptodactylus fuscus]